MWQAAIGPITKLAGNIFDRILPDKTAAAAAKADFQLALLAQEGEELKTKMSAIIMEAKSLDPWTSRARPSFLYVMYLLIIVNGVLAPFAGIFAPEAMALYFTNLGKGLNAIPESVWALFGAGYLGYVGAREYGKAKLLK